MDEVRVQVLPDGRVARSDAAKFLGYQAKTLAEWHRLGKGPRSHMVGGRRFYHIDDLRTFATGSSEVTA
jgi:hypothetical protein